MKNFARITGTGSYLPSKIITNFDLEKTLDTSDEWITARTGIKERRIVTNESTCDLAIEVFYCKITCLLYTSPSPRDRTRSRMPSSA